MAKGQQHSNREVKKPKKKKEAAAAPAPVLKGIPANLSDQRVEIPIRYLTQLRRPGWARLGHAFLGRPRPVPGHPPVNLRGNVELHLERFLFISNCARTFVRF
jgi:hypothetical protein